MRGQRISFPIEDWIKCACTIAVRTTWCKQGNRADISINEWFCGSIFAIRSFCLSLSLFILFYSLSTIIRTEKKRIHKQRTRVEWKKNQERKKKLEENQHTLVNLAQKPYHCIPFKTIYSRFKYALFMSILPALVYTIRCGNPLTTQLWECLIPSTYARSFRSWARECKNDIKRIYWTCERTRDRDRDRKNNHRATGE